MVLFSNAHCIESGLPHSQTETESTRECFSNSRQTAPKHATSAQRHTGEILTIEWLASHLSHLQRSRILISDAKPCLLLICSAFHDMVFVHLRYLTSSSTHVFSALTCSTSTTLIPGLSVLENSGASQSETSALRLDSIGIAQISSKDKTQVSALHYEISAANGCCPVRQAVSSFAFRVLRFYAI